MRGFKDVVYIADRGSIYFVVVVTLNNLDVGLKLLFFFLNIMEDKFCSNIFYLNETCVGESAK